jgi:hypothetical protein
MLKKSVSYTVKTFKNSDDADDDEMLTKDDLIVFYEKHDPSKVVEIDDFIRGYSSAVIIQTLLGKYGEAPIELALSEEDLTTFYKKHDASKVKEVKKLMKEFDANFIIKTLVQKYGDPSIIKRAADKYAKVQGAGEQEEGEKEETGGEDGKAGDRKGGGDFSKKLEDDNQEGAGETGAAADAEGMPDDTDFIAYDDEVGPMILTPPLAFAHSGEVCIAGLHLGQCSCESDWMSSPLC